MRRGSETLAAALLAMLLAVGLVACGEDGDSTSTQTAATTAKPAEPAGEASSGGSERSKQQGRSKSSATPAGKEEGGGAAQFTPKQHHDSGGGSAQFKVKGGDNSVQEFGEEGEGSEFEAAAALLHDFLDARAEGNWGAVCQFLAKSTVESLERLAAQSKKGGIEGCGEVLEAIINPSARQSMREEAAKADVGSLRTEGDQGFVLYTTGGKTIYTVPLTREGNEWKIGGLAGTPLN